MSTPTSTMQPFAMKYESPLGPLLLTASETALHGAWYLQQQHFPQNANYYLEKLHNPAACERWDSPLLRKAADELTRYFAGTLKEFSVPLQPVGTPFQESVWQELTRIPYGKTITYSDVATAVGKPTAVRAVGGMIGRNPLGIFIPCHRVIGKSGQLTGYAGGLDKKTFLLRLEGVLQPVEEAEHSPR